MTKRILIVGMETFDSGKTTLATQLATSFIERGISVEYFKPISAHNHVERHAHSLRCIREHKLYSYDAARLRHAMQTSQNVFLMNPIHRLYVPAVAKYQTEEMQRKMGTLALAGVDSVIALERISVPRKKQIDSTFLISSQFIGSKMLAIEKVQIDQLSNEGRRIDITSLEELQQFEADRVEESLTQSLNALEERAEVVLIESFNDSVWPWEELHEVNHVIAVSPKVVAAYHPKKFRKAAFLMKHKSLPIRAVTHREVADLMEPYAKQPANQISLDHGDILERLGISIQQRSIK